MRMGVLDGMLKADGETSACRKLTFADIDPAGIVESCLLVARPLAEKAGLALSAEVPAQPAAHRRRCGEPAADAAQPAGQRHQVRALRRPGEGDASPMTLDGPLRISVVDTGPGMQEADHAADQMIRAAAPDGPPTRAWGSACR